MTMADQLRHRLASQEKSKLYQLVQKKIAMVNERCLRLKSRLGRLTYSQPQQVVCRGVAEVRKVSAVLYANADDVARCANGECKSRCASSFCNMDSARSASCRKRFYGCQVHDAIRPRSSIMRTRSLKLQTRNEFRLSGCHTSTGHNDIRISGWDTASKI
jgi:hypothetical protein